MIHSKTHAGGCSLHDTREKRIWGVGGDLYHDNLLEVHIGLILSLCNLTMIQGSPRDSISLFVAKMTNKL